MHHELNLIEISHPASLEAVRTNKGGGEFRKQATLNGYIIGMGIAADAGFDVTKTTPVVAIPRGGYPMGIGVAGALKHCLAMQQTKQRAGIKPYHFFTSRLPLSRDPQVKYKRWTEDDYEQVDDLFTPECIQALRDSGKVILVDDSINKGTAMIGHLRNLVSHHGMRDLEFYLVSHFSQTAGLDKVTKYAQDNGLSLKVFTSNKNMTQTVDGDIGNKAAARLPAWSVDYWCGNVGSSLGRFNEDGTWQNPRLLDR